MKKRTTIKTLIIISLVFTIGVCLFVQLEFARNKDTILTKLHVLALNDNNISVDFNPEINSESIIIKDQSGTIIYKNGELVENLHNEYGHVVFSFYTNDTLFAQAGHFKRNWWFTHDYQIQIEKENGDYKINLDINGPEKFQDDFIKYIKESENDSLQYSSYRTNGELINKWIEKK
ncbi:hypothetical protein [Sediminitomix flava]|uniref:Uncharacterized protein n=1 Tax=Sediminitomix flava TaxID=379075 RepID=A0A315YWC0_SEDFL|nr:hypothetical protein [Sediminitomix flava]PWJ32898.1 hypothetical protein BC781_1184 [Sediminitomix flava]